MQNANADFNSFYTDMNMLVLRFQRVSAPLSNPGHYSEDRGAWSMDVTIGPRNRQGLSEYSSRVTSLATGYEVTNETNMYSEEIPAVIDVVVQPLTTLYVSNPAHSYDGRFELISINTHLRNTFAEPQQRSRIFPTSQAFSPYIPTLCNVDDVCPICASRGKASDKWVRLPCHRMHIFHYKCAAKLPVAKCPLCRETFKDADVRVCDSENHQVKYGQDITKVGKEEGWHRYNAQNSAQTKAQVQTNAQTRAQVQAQAFQAQNGIGGSSRRVLPSPRTRPKPKPKPTPKPKTSPRARPKAKTKAKAKSRPRRK